jgi:type IV secretory pathway VirB9-like protein
MLSFMVCVTSKMSYVSSMSTFDYATSADAYRFRSGTPCTGPDGRPALVNYRVRGTTYIVDRLFAAAELRLGTAPQRVVRIVRSDAVWRETQQ